jgi:putative protein kinase ArgK-like GTPase of G3E family
LVIGTDVGVTNLEGDSVLNEIGNALKPENTDESRKGIAKKVSIDANSRSKSMERKQTLTNYGRNIVRICLTGGPCAGKTTILAELKQNLI